ncbi:MAG: hypothetical protein RG741_03200 [Bacteroidales bacterium]|nr:hypothetical protein [Bacteroidales bacterium]
MYYYMKLLAACGIYFIICSLTVFTVQAQLSFLLFADAGSNQVSDGWYTRSIAAGSYNTGLYAVAGGVQFKLQGNSNALNGAFVNAGRQLVIREYPVQAKAFFAAHRFSELMYETNWGVMAETSYKQFDVKAGTSFRRYAFTKSAVEAYDISEEGSQLRENFNMVYRAGYSLNPYDHSWNIRAFVTNLDHIVINQETNPILGVSGFYRISDSFSLLLEARYLSAGAFNLSVNPFGYVFRTGIRWESR